MPPAPPTVVYESAASIRKRFNESQIPMQIQSGELVETFLHNKELDCPEPWQGPPGTRSQIVRYASPGGEWVATVHRYLRPDGSLGASGKLDPKRLRIGGIIYVKRDVT